MKWSDEFVISDNAGCGYVLKPDFLRDNSIAYSPNSPSELDVEKYPSWKIKVKIISGQHIPKAEGSDDIIDPYIKLRLRGHPDDEVNSEGDKINKGQLISEWLFGVLNLPKKKQPQNLKEFCPQI